MTPEEWGYSVVGGLGTVEREVHMEIVKLTAHAVCTAIAEEREACAKVAEKVRISSPYDHVTDNLIQGIIARDIRARGKEGKG